MSPILARLVPIREPLLLGKERYREREREISIFSFFAHPRKSIARVAANCRVSSLPRSPINFPLDRTIIDDYDYYFRADIFVEISLLVVSSIKDNE